MADEALARAGLYFDELNKMRVLKPQATQVSGELKDECKDFVQKVSQFQEMVDNQIMLVDSLSKQVEEAKMKAIGTRNMLKSVKKQKDAEQQQLQLLIKEKQIELERLRLEHEALVREESEVKEHLHHFLSPM